jgi:hypothetical protein
MRAKLPPRVRAAATVAVGLGVIPLIVEPIDHGVHALMNKSVRVYGNTFLQRWLHVTPTQITTAKIPGNIGEEL